MVRLSARQLLVAALYSVSMLLATLNFALNAGTYATLDILLMAGALAPWAVVSVQGLYRKYHARTRDVSPEKYRDEDPTNNIRGSTHSTANALLFMMSSLFFLAADARNLATPTAMLLTRMIGSTFWLMATGIFLWTARKIERQQEDIVSLSTEISPQKDPTPYYLAGETSFLTAGMLYHAAIWLDARVVPLKLAGNICWLLAGLHDTAHQAVAFYRRNNPSAFFTELNVKPQILLDEQPVLVPAV